MRSTTATLHSHAFRRAIPLLSFLLVVMLAAIVPCGAEAVLLAGPDGATNTNPPPNDPGFANVGVIGNFSGVYVGNGWVLTANHVGANPILLGGVLYDPVPGSYTRFSNGTALADLIAFRLYERPPLPDLVLTTGPPVVNDDVVMIGNGRDRGSATTWMNIDGWNWAGLRTIRWGTNVIDFVGLGVAGPPTAPITEAFYLDFDDISGMPGWNESQAVKGDSGGAVFFDNGGTWELIGILFANAGFENQPVNTSFFGNRTFAADLWEYAPDILARISQNECNDGLDQDGDGVSDYPNDPGCEDEFDTTETSPALICDNGIDDDADLLIDYPEDDGCSSLTDPTEVPEPGFGLALGFGVAMLTGLRRRTT